MDFDLSRLTIRPAQADDSLCLSVLAMQVFLDTYAINGIRPAIAREVLGSYSIAVFDQLLADPRNGVEIAEHEGQLIGFSHTRFGAAQALLPHVEQTELYRLYVQEPFTGRGVGRALLQSAEARAGARGAALLWLTPWVHNHRARGFYAAQGYEDWGVDWFCFEGESHENRVVAKALVARRVA